jgi:aspartyl-tRNA(Asn)/glutamyl-tRNA(Gln) amidotransferase subunit A
MVGTASELRPLLQRGEITAQEVVRSCLEVVRRREPDIRAFVYLDAEAALAQAEALDARRRRGEPLGPLAGLPVALKDNLCVRGVPTTCASKALAQFRPPYDAEVVRRLRAADAILFGKTNLDEFAMGSSTESSAFQITRNPWDRERTPGGSSGGSAAAVAAGEVPLALGTDTGGSIRQPASFCGLVGLKPTYGRVSRFGLVAYGSSLDQIGPLTREVRDAALLLEVLAGHDPRDSTSVPEPVPPYSQLLETSPLPLTIGVVREHFAAGLDAEVEEAVRQAVRVYADLGVRICEVSLPHTPYAIAAYYLVATAEASSNLARYDGVHYGYRAPQVQNLLELYCRSRGQSLGREVKRRIMLGTFVLSEGYKDAYYLKALQVRRLIKQDYDQAFSHCDLLLGPTAPTPAFRLGERLHDPLAMYLSDIYTISSNLAGLPALSIPCGFTRQGLPIGLQLQAPPFAEDKLLRAAYLYQQVTDWHRRQPPLA